VILKEIIIIINMKDKENSKFDKYEKSLHIFCKNHFISQAPKAKRSPKLIVLATDPRVPQEQAE